MKKKVVFFIGGLNFGGMERVVFIAEELLKNDYDVSIVTLYQDNADYDAKEKYYNINVSPSSKKLLTFIKRFIGTLKMKRELKPDIVFSFGMYLNYLNVISNYFSKNKSCTIVGIRSYDWLTNPFMNKSLDRWVMRHANKINSVSEVIAKDADFIWGIPYKENTVIYNPYNIEYLQKKAMEEIDDFVFDSNNYYITTMGRLSNQKGYNHLIRAFSEVKKIHKNVKLIIMGNGDKKDDLNNMIYEYNLEDSIFLLGGKANPHKYVKASSLYVLSSLSEGFPNALAETMCIGTPVIAVNCKSGPAEILCGQNVEFEEKESFRICKYGILSEEMTSDNQYSKKNLNNSEIALAKAICYAYENKEKMNDLAKAAIKHMQSYSYEEFKNKLIYILDK